MWYIHSIGEWNTYPKYASMDAVFLLVLQLINNRLYSCASVDRSTLHWQKRLRKHRHINAFFGLKKVVIKKKR